MTFARQSRPVRLRHPRKRLWWMNGPSAIAIHENAPFGGRTALLPSPSTKTPYLVDERPFCHRHPRKRLIWWTNGPSAIAIHENASFGGRTALLPSPSTKMPHLVDERPFCHRHPPKCPIWWMAIIPNSGPSGQEAIFPDGHPLALSVSLMRGLEGPTAEGKRGLSKCQHEATSVSKRQPGRVIVGAGGRPRRGGWRRRR